MRILPNIGNSHLEQMNLIYEFICNFDVHNLLFAINGKQLDEEQIISLTNDISEYHIKLKRQKQNLFKFCKTFPKEFASENNKCAVEQQESKSYSKGSVGFHVNSCQKEC